MNRNNQYKSPFKSGEVNNFIKKYEEYIELEGASVREMHRWDMVIKALSRQISLKAHIEHKKGDEAALITCPTCHKSIIANLVLYKEFNKEWHCKECGQKLSMK